MHPLTDWYAGDGGWAQQLGVSLLDFPIDNANLTPYLASHTLMQSLIPSPNSQAS